MNSFLASLAAANLILIDDSVESALTAAAVLRIVGKFDIEVRSVDLYSERMYVNTSYPRDVLFIGGLKKRYALDMVRGLIEKLTKGGGKIVGIIDEHRAEWLEVLGTFDGVGIEPQESEVEKGTARLVAELLESECEVVDGHTRHLLTEGSRAHQGNYSCNGMAQMAAVVCAHVAPQTRRQRLDHAVRRFAIYDIMDSVMQEWWKAEMCLQWFAFIELKGCFHKTEEPKGFCFAAQSAAGARRQVIEFLIVRNEMHFPQLGRMSLDEAVNLVMNTPVTEGDILSPAELISFTRLKPIE